VAVRLKKPDDARELPEGGSRTKILHDDSLQNLKRKADPK